MASASLHLGDCLEIMPTLEAGSVDLVICDPPYTMTKRGKSCRPNWMPNGMGANVFGGTIPLAEEWMARAFRLLRMGTHFYTFCNTNDLSSYLVAAARVGFRLHNVLSMIKDTGMPNRWYLKQTELVLFFRKGAAKPINDMTSRDWCRVEMPTERNGKLHITQKPLGFVERLVTNSSLPGEIVLDLFAGSGTTGVACMNTGRNFIGIERDPAYFAIAERRINEAKQSLLVA
jgi:DNA modification methylase